MLKLGYLIFDSVHDEPLRVPEAVNLPMDGQPPFNRTSPDGTVTRGLLLNAPDTSHSADRRHDAGQPPLRSPRQVPALTGGRLAPIAVRHCGTPSGIVADARSVDAAHASYTRRRTPVPPSIGLSPPAVDNSICVGEREPASRLHGARIAHLAVVPKAWRST